MAREYAKDLDMEEYEKCAELVRMKKQYEESLLKPVKKTIRKKAENKLK